MIDKILNGQKTIESRWYMQKRCPWDCIKKGDTIYFKNSGENVIASSCVEEVIQVSDLNPEKIIKILNEYWRRLGIPRGELTTYFEIFKNKKYCVLVFLNKVKVIEPFSVDKLKAEGTCLQSAWVTLKDINEIRI